MKALACALIVALAAGCASTRVRVDAASGAAGALAAPVAGTRVTSGAVGLHVESGSNSLATALFAIALLAGAIEYSREPQSMPSPSALFPQAGAPAPELAPDRRVNEQDCTRPVDFFAGNLRCR